MLAHRCEERALLDAATAIESVPGLLGGLAASGWVREVGILLAVTLLTWPLSLLLTHRIPEHVADERHETGVLRRFLRVVVWPLAALMFSAVGLEVLRHLRPDWVGQSSGVLPILGFFLVFRLVNQLLREVLPPGSRRRRLRRVVVPTLFVLLVLQQLQLLDPTIRVIQRPLVTAGDTPISLFSILVENKVINYSYGDELKRVDVPVGVSYRSDPNRVREILLEVARACDDVLAKPEPGVLFEAFGESSIDFTLRSWIDDAWKLPQVRSRLLFEIRYALMADGIEIPFPQRDLHLRSAVELPLRREDEA